MTHPCTTLRVVFVIVGLLIHIRDSRGFQLIRGPLHDFIAHSSLTKVSATVSPTEQYRQMMDAEARRIKEESIKRLYTEEIERLTSGDGCDSQLLDPDFWQKFARGGLTVMDPKLRVLDGSHMANKEVCESQREHLYKRGFLKADANGFDWSKADVDMDAIAATMDALKEDGWPPVFVYMFDQPWRLCAGMFELMGPILGFEDIELEASVFGWALDKPTLDELERQQTGEDKVWGNFGMPHRDLAFDKCHLKDGTPSVVSVWVPVTDATLDNGCMYVVPREHDKFFDKCGPMEMDDHYTPFDDRHFPYACVHPLPVSKGTPLAWHPNTIHWGSSCSAYADKPRKSLAMAFRLPSHQMDLSDQEKQKQLQLYGREPYTRSEVERGLSMPQRLAMCAQSLLMYSVWFPEFDGLDSGKLSTIESCPV